MGKPWVAALARVRWGPDTYCVAALKSSSSVVSGNPRSLAMSAKCASAASSETNHHSTCKDVWLSLRSHVAKARNFAS